MQFAGSSLANLSTCFRFPLESTGVDVSLLEEELKDMIRHAKCNIVVEEYAFWWKQLMPNI